MKRRHWTEEERNFLEFNYGVMDTRDIARKLNRTVESIVYQAYFLGYTLEDYRERLTNKDLSEILNKSTGAICYLLDTKKIKSTKVLYAGNTSITTVKIEWLKDFLKSNPSYTLTSNKEMLEDLGILEEVSNITPIKLGYRHWSFLEEEALMKMWREGATFKEIGEELDRTEVSVRKKHYNLSKNNIK